MIHITFYWDGYFPFRAFAVKLWGDVYKATWPSKRKRLQFSGQVKAVYPICGCILFWGLFPGMLHEHLKVLDDHTKIANAWSMTSSLQMSRVCSLLTCSLHFGP